MNIAHSLGWTLIHSIWEIASIAVLFFLANLFMRRAAANVRYTVGLVALTMCLAGPVATIAVLAPSPVQVRAATSRQVIQPSLGIAVVQPVMLPESSIPFSPAAKTIGERLDPILPTIVLCWLLGLTFMCLRLAGGLFLVERIKRQASTHGDANWQDLLNTLASKLGVRRSVSLMVSDRVATPAVVGLFKTVILFPASALTKLGPESIEALLAHELAHVRRHDYIVNFAQSVVETVLFYHPAAWWISSVVRTEREHCCDDMALSALGDRQQYAQALMSLEQIRHSAPRLAMAANRGHLLSRIRRIVLPAEGRMIPASAWITLFLALSISVGLAGTLRTKPGRPAQKPQRSTPLKPSDDKRITGRVIDAGGHPVEGATVMRQPVNYEPVSARPMQETLTDAKGGFQFSTSQARGAEIMAIRQGVGMGLADWTGGIPVIRLQPVKQISVRAVDASGAPVQGATIGPISLSTRSQFANFREGSDLFHKFAAKTDNDGRATLENIPANASVNIGVEEEHFVVMRRSGFLKAPRKDSQVQITLEPAGSVEGSVLESGHPSQFMSIFTNSEDGSYRGFSPVDSVGRFRLKHLPAGTQVLHGRTWHGFNRAWSDPETRVTVVPDTVQHVDLKVGSGLPITVSVHSPTGHPLAGLNLRIEHADGKGFDEAGGPTDKNGVFEGRVSPGPHKVVLEQWTEEVSQTVNVREDAANSISLQAPIEEQDARIVCRLTDADGKQVGATTVSVGCIDFHNKRINLNYVTDQFGKAIVFIPASRVKTMWAHAKSGDQSTDPVVRPKNGVITLRMHKNARSVSIDGPVSKRSQAKLGKASYAPQPKRETLEQRLVGNWTGQIPNVKASYPPKKEGEHWTYETMTATVALVMNNDHTYSETMSTPRHPQGATLKGKWSINGQYITLAGTMGVPLIATLSLDGKRLEHISIKTWQELRKTNPSLDGLRTISFSRS